MTRLKIPIIFLILCLFSFTFLTIHAQESVNIFTEKTVYSYGDILIFTIEVSEITDDFATLYIIDESKKKSSPIPIPITELKTVVPSPYAFESTVYPEGKYILEIKYGGITDTAEFELIDSGKIVIPFWIKEFSKYWYNGIISDIEFANGIQFLIKEGIIVVPQAQSEENSSEVKIPNWIKASTGWWIDGIISDKEYASSLEYLIKMGIIVV